MSAFFLFSACVLFILQSCIYTRPDWRVGMLKGFTFFGTAIVLFAELLSAVDHLQYTTLMCLWGITVGVLLLHVLHQWKTQHLRLPIISMSPTFTRMHVVVLALVPVILLVLLTGFLTLKTPVNNWDSLAYRMTRVEYWIQQKSLKFYATHDQRQLYVPPFTEMFMLHLRLLSSSDTFAGLPQWTAMLISLLGVSVIVRQLGGNTRQQYLSVLVASTIPMGVLQAMSTQTDYVVSGWLVCFIVFFFEYMKQSKSQSLWLMSLSLGLAALTKPTALFLALPFVLWLIVYELQRFSKFSLIKGLFFILLCCMLAAGHYTRNYSYYGHPFAHGNDPAYLVGSVHPIKLASNLIKNIFSHFSLPSYEINLVTTQAVNWIHAKILHLDVNHPDTTWPDTVFELFQVWSESVAGNPLHVLLILLCLTLMLREKNAGMRRYALALSLGSLLLFTLLKWQPWITRLHLSALILFSPLAGYHLAKIPKAFVSLIFLLLCIQTIPVTLYAFHKPLLQQPNVFTQSDDDLIFIDKPYLKTSFNQLIEFLKEKRFAKMGVFYYGDEWEYPIIKRMRELGVPYHSKHVSLWHEAAPLEDLSYQPDAVIFIRSRRQEPEVKFRTYQKKYKNTKYFSYYIVYYNE